MSNSRSVKAIRNEVWKLHPNKQNRKEYKW